MPRGGDGFSGPLSSIAVAGIALGVVVMVMAVSILRGFQADISGKVVGFGSHLTVTGWGSGIVGSEHPIAADPDLEARLLQLPEVRHVQAYATKGGMVKTDDQIYGILFRGLGANYDTTFFASCLVEGRLPRLTKSGERRAENEERKTENGELAAATDSTQSSVFSSQFSAPSNDVLISSTIAARLGLHVGDKMRTYFWQEQTYRSRAFEVCGIYNTDLGEMDELYVVGDLLQVQRLNGWDAESVARRTESDQWPEAGGQPAAAAENPPAVSYIGGYELLVDDFDRLDEAAEAVTALLPIELTVQTIRQAYPALFSWLDLLEANITLILTIMCIVSAVAIVSALLIMIFEKRSTIGTLKALGADSASVRKIFVIKSSQLIAKGIVIGDAVALALSIVQQRWQVVKLDPESYSMSHVPVEISVWIYVIISAATFAVCLLALLLPAAYISRISPAKTMRSEN